MQASPVISLRYDNTSTDANLAAITGLIKSKEVKKVIFFSSPSELTDNATNADGPNTNFPLVSVLVLYEIPNIASLYILFDGCFLTAQRYPRYCEVRDLLDVALAKGNVFFSTQTVDFTSGKPADVAVNELLSIDSLEPLDETTRADYFSKLCVLTEEQMQEH